MKGASDAPCLIPLAILQSSGCVRCVPQHILGCSCYLLAHNALLVQALTCLSICTVVHQLGNTTSERSHTSTLQVGIHHFLSAFLLLTPDRLELYVLQDTVKHVAAATHMIPCHYRATIRCQDQLDTWRAETQHTAVSFVLVTHNTQLSKSDIHASSTCDPQHRYIRGIWSSACSRFPHEHVRPVNLQRPAYTYI